MDQSQVLHQLPGFKSNTAFENLKQSCYLVAYLVVFAGIKQGLVQRLQHELHKRRGLAVLVRSAKGCVIGILPLAYHRLHRQPGQHWTPQAQYQRLPQTPHPPIAICKRMNEFKLVMKYTTGKQRVQVSTG